MSASAALPPSLHHQLNSLARRVRVLRALHGGSLLLIALVVPMSVALLADYCFGLPSAARLALFLTWAAVGIASAVHSILLPLCRKLSPAGLAALIEEHFPDLGERLTTAVELAGSRENPHGSPTLVALLIEETAARTRGLDFHEAVPAGEALRLAGAAAVLLFLAGFWAVLWPRHSFELGQRFLLPWRTIETIRAFGTTDPKAAIEPVELAADSPTIVITPPPYAKKSIEEQTIHGLADLTALQYSRIRFDFQFTRPVHRATLEWPAPAAGDDGAKGIPLSIHPLVLTKDHCGASCELPALAGGGYRLILEGEQGIRSELKPRILTVHVDQPPAFLKIIINDKLATSADQNAKPAREHPKEASPRDDSKTILPSESLAIDIALADDVGVERAELEYRTNEGALQRQPIPLQPLGGREATGQCLFQLAGKSLHEGDTLRYRIRVEDNRNLPEANLAAHVIYYPTDGRWLRLKIADKAPPLRQREIVAQRDEIDRRLEEIKQNLLGEKLNLRSLRADARQQRALDKKQAKKLKQLREQNRTTENALRELARVAGEISPLQMLADQARATADQEMRRSDKALQNAEKETQPQPRDYRFDDSDKEIASALDRVDSMRLANAQLAQTRLDLAKLEGLSDREQQLAERASGELVPAPGSPNRDQELKHAQKEIAHDLQRLAQQSAPIRKALDAARAEEARGLAAKARELAQAERDLLEAERQARQGENDLRRAELAQKQQELAERVRRLAKGIRLAAQAANSTPLRPEAAGQAAQALRENNTGLALQLQHQNQDELARLAKELDQASEGARQPREAARQLARLQEALRRSMDEQESKDHEKTDQLEAARREQEALRRAVDNLQVPAKDPAATKQQHEAVERATQAVEALENHNARHAEVRMAQAQAALEQLAEQLPKDQPPTKKNATQAAPASVSEPTAEKTPVLPGLPSHEQASQLRELAQQQQEMIAAVQGLMSREAQAKRGQRENPVSDLSRQQMEIARQATELASTVSLERGPQAPATRQSQQAAQSAQATSRFLLAGAIQSAYQTGTRTAQELRELGDQLSQPPGGQGNARSGGTLEKARRLGQRQEELNRRMAALAANSDAQKAHQQARQQQLEQQTNELSQDLNQLTQQMADSSLARLSTQRAAESGQHAQAAMKLAHDSDQQGNQRQEQQAQQEAAADLDQASRQAELAAEQMAAALDLSREQSDPAPSASQPGQALQQAEREMGQAEAQLGQGRHPTARLAMQGAAQALQRAARQLAQQGAQSNPMGRPNGRGVTQAGLFDPSLFGSDAKEYAGRRWGELPGELRTKIIQDMQARYGEDYARIIKLYFEQIADTNK